MFDSLESHPAWISVPHSAAGVVGIISSFGEMSDSI